VRGRIKKEEGRRKKEEGRRKKEEGRRLRTDEPVSQNLVNRRECNPSDGSICFFRVNDVQKRCQIRNCIQFGEVYQEQKKKKASEKK
jgi:hypothetical protein